jgi:hypothetical protein
MDTDRRADVLVETVEEGPVACDGLQVEHAEGSYAVETPEASETGLDETGLRDLLSEHERLLHNWWTWHRVSGDRRAFLRWVEGADEHPVAERYDALTNGLTTEWGDLRIRVELVGEGIGERRYELRHVEDADVPVDDLERVADPLDLRRPLKFDDDGRYRPLKTAPNTPTGWRLDGLSGRDLVKAVDVAYPATVANWYREGEGELDVSHWRETAERQTGIYGIIDELPREAVEWVAEAACVDSQCLKRREWDYEEDDELAADRGDGPFPCREPCSLVVAAARKWTTLEREDERTYEFTLTPSEKEQVEAVVDAVADGTTDEIREADVYEGANRYRARYLRAKRMDDDGNFCGVPTDPEDWGGGEDEDDH